LHEKYGWSEKWKEPHIPIRVIETSLYLRGYLSFGWN
jgi:hypothetical protein